MNWTGGTLQRTKKANKGTLQRQKAHFARARTNLQNCSYMSIVPFCPSYLQQDDQLEGTKEPTPLESQLLRQKRSGRQSRLQTAEAEEVDGNDPPWTKCPRTSLHGFALPPLTWHEDLTKRISNEVRAEAKSHASGGLGHDKRNASEASQEAQLLEAKKRRLLKQHDWIGVAPSKPPDMQFLTNKEGSKFGKCRRVQNDRKGKEQERGHANFDTRKRYRDNDDHFQYFMSGALQKETGQIRIRIGTDALTTACSTRLGNGDRSHASTEPMLFDQQTDEKGKLDAPYALGTLMQNGGEACKNDIYSPATLAREAHGRYGHSQHDRSSPFAALTEHGTDISGKSTVTPELGKHDKRSKRNVTPDLHIIQHVDGAERPLRLIFDSPHTSASVRSHIVPQLKHDGGTKFAHMKDYAACSGSGSMPPGCTDFDLLPDYGDTARSNVDDEKPWKQFLDFPSHRSSESYRATEHRQSGLHGILAGQDMTNHASWSQRVMQGDRTFVSSPSAIITTPSSRRLSEMHGLVLRKGTENNGQSKRNEGTLRAATDENEALWQEFIFGDIEASPPQMPDQLHDGSERMARRASSGYLPLSVAVSSISPTPFRPASICSSCVDKDTNFTARIVCGSGSRTLSSPDAHPVDFVGHASEASKGVERAGCSGVGVDAVTHASLSSIASCNTSFTSRRMYNDLETSRPKYTTGTSQEVFASSEVGRQVEYPLMYDMNDSDEQGLDLVDPESIV